MFSRAPSSSQPPPEQEKINLRRRLLKARQAIPAPTWRQKSDRICAHLQTWPGFQTARGILAYWSFRNEPDLSPLIDTRRLWGLPRCVGQEMQWHQWQGPQSLTPGQFGILEPSPDTPQLIATQVDLILLPAVACDVTGYRLGYGGGFYDRMLSQPHWRQKDTIAILFDYARLPSLPKQPWDRPVKGICTETGLYLSDEI